MADAPTPPAPAASPSDAPAAPSIVGEVLAEGKPKKRLKPVSVVIFGVTGDLAGRKLAPALFNVMLDDGLSEPTKIIGLSRGALGPGELANKLAPKVAEHSRRAPTPETWAKFASMLEYVAGEFADDATYVELGKALDAARAAGTGGNRVFYLSVPPDAFPMIVGKLHEHGLMSRDQSNGFIRVIVEKPFGRDMDSARALNDLIGGYLDESQIYRIDHYLGKETVQNILVLRFGNSIFEPVWNRSHVSHVEITAAEAIGIEGRGAFYESTGVVRDIIQNHLLQVMALVAMEVPASFKADDVRDEKSQVLRSMRDISADDIKVHAVRGQYEGYRSEPGVAPDSQVPTYTAIRFMIDSWRWEGVPFYMRAGKKLAERKTEIAIYFKSVPLVLFKNEQAGEALQPAVLTLTIQPHEGISLRFVAKVPGESITIGNVLMTMTYADAFKRPIAEAYERLLTDCIRGDATLFNRRDSVDRAWELIEPILRAWDAAPGVELYPASSAGPAGADALMARDGRAWRPLGPPPATPTPAA